MQATYMQKMNLTLSGNLPETELINRIINGETDLYEIIMRKYNPRLYRVGRGFFGDNDDEIEDVMQFTYIRAYEKLSSFENRSAFSTWLTRIFINEAIARKKYGSRFLSIPDEENSIDDIFSENNYMRNPYRMTANNELKELLEKSINELPERYRLVFIMYEIEKLSVRETGECLNITESNVKVRLNRARKMLRDNLSQYYKVDDLYSFNLVRCDVIVNNVLHEIKSKENGTIN